MKFRISKKSIKTLWLIVVMAVLLSAPAAQVVLRKYHVPDPAHVAAMIESLPADCSQSADPDWIAKVNRLRWVAYSSPNFNTEPGYFQPSAEAIYADLVTLRKANFNGLVTYASSGIMGKQFLEIAQSLGFKGIIMGIWNPRNRDEMDHARHAASLPIVLGYSIGNEGLYEDRSRYTIGELCSAIADLRSTTGRPASTSEQIDDYDDHPELLYVGDWIFPIAHPYWHSTKYPLPAVKWVRERYTEMAGKTDRFVFFKEQGLPTSGAYALSEENHDLYYRELEKTSLPFVYFEGFDQPSKDHAAVEPHWGIFRSSHRPKTLAWNLMGYRKFTSSASYDGWIKGCSGTNVDGCALDTSGNRLFVGFDSGNLEYRGFLAFSTAGLPDDALITSVVLKIRSPGVEGANPLKGHPQLLAKACRPFYGLDWELQLSDFQTGLKCQDAGIFDKTPRNGWYTLDFTPTAFQLIDLTGTTQFRLSVRGAEALKKGYLKFYSGDAADPNRPILVVRYAIQ